MELYKSNAGLTDAEGMGDICLAVNDAHYFVVRVESPDDFLPAVPNPIIVLGEIQPEFMLVLVHQFPIELRDCFHFFVRQRQAGVYRSGRSYQVSQSVDLRCRPIAIYCRIHEVG